MQVRNESYLSKCVNHIEEVQPIVFRLHYQTEAQKCCHLPRTIHHDDCKIKVRPANRQYRTNLNLTPFLI
jgi:hypothetical protein